MKNLTRNQWLERNWEKWEIKEELRAKYVSMESEQAEKIWIQQSAEWKDIQEKQRKINFKKTGIKETNLERKKREESLQRKINFKKTGIKETNLERKKREDDEKIKKINERSKKIEDFIKKKPGSDCFTCRTKVDEKGLCYC
ncbi:MAG: hypothetical protein CMC31_00295 [Flavobacteriaceae bacterium]|nr:hypothetical protein [Flavobacteriaceae bacterium]